MAIQNFSKLLQEKVYKDWLAKLDKNIVTSPVKALRSREQTASKTSFYITEKTVGDMFKTITGKEIDSLEIQALLEDLRNPEFTSDKKTTGLQGEYINVNGQRAVFFKNIGFDTISEKLSQVINTIPEVEIAYQQAEERFVEQQLKELRRNPKFLALKGNQQQAEIDKIYAEGKRRASLGFYFNKGHVIAVATNLARQFREEIKKADVLAERQRKLLIDVLDKYIDKLVKDDLATANLPNAITQEMYAKYIKSSDKYLVEMQVATGNIEAGTASAPIVEELRELFGGKLAENELLKVLSTSPKLGEALLEEKGSPSMLELIADELFDAIKTGKTKKTTYRSPKVKVGESKIRINKPKRKTKQINAAKALLNKVKNTKSKPDRVVNKPETTVEASLVSLQNILNGSLVEQIKKNMGRGERRDILNLRSGRFAESVKVERLSESREGMITAFYTYMKNPYATFSAGGRQDLPRSRDPKLLISKSIRELLQQQVANRLRAVNI
jgi:hypothetical protein